MSGDTRDLSSTPARPPGLRVRVAAPTDTGALMGLLEEIMHHHGIAPPPAGDLQRTLDEIFASPSHEFLVAEAADGILGTCALVYSISTWSAGPVCEIQDVVVTERSRAAGVGRALITAAERRARERGCRRLFLSAETPNLGGHAFYRSLGLMEKTTLHFELALTDSTPGA